MGGEAPLYSARISSAQTMPIYLLSGADARVQLSGKQDGRSHAESPALPSSGCFPGAAGATAGTAVTGAGVVAVARRSGRLLPVVWWPDCLATQCVFGPQGVPFQWSAGCSSHRPVFLCR